MPRPFVFVLVLLFLGAAPKATSPTGSFSIEAAGPFATTPNPPQVNGRLTFRIVADNLPPQGGATVYAWVELECTANGQTVFAGLSPNNNHIPSDPADVNEAIFDPLTSPEWQVAGYPAASCDAWLFYDGANNPRRRKTNTLASLQNLAVVGL